MFVSIVALIFGLIIGSFLNVCIVRLPKGESIINPGSHCRSCSEPVAWYDNLPLFAYINLGGRCRACGDAIPSRYPLVEAMTGATLMGLARLNFPAPEFALFAALSCALIVIIFIDIDYMIIPDVITLPSILIAPGLAFFVGHITVVESLLGVLIGGGLLWGIALFYELVRKQEGMGFGDVKLLAMIGGVLGWGATLFTLMVATITGSIVGLAVLVARRGRLDSEIPFGPFLAFGAFLYIVAGQEIINWYFSGVLFR